VPRDRTRLVEAAPEDAESLGRALVEFRAQLARLGDAPGRGPVKRVGEPRVSA
jgi:hypothetical protein